MHLISRYFPNLSAQQEQQFSELEELYRFWNAQINVISRKDLDNLYLNHVLHSLSIAKLIAFKDGTKVVDVGTGGGFPGIPLAILFPKTEFHLIDSIGKKIKVVQSVSQQLQLQNVKSTQICAQELKSQYDFVVSRAVTNLPDFYRFTQHLIAKKSFNILPNGILYLKGGYINSELTQINRKSTQYTISDWFSESYFKEKYVVHVIFN
ncbi:MAG: 16S rRNA (guanine(527)-N(7))-methyltransferase RsmG [Bacteroidales bacterium]|jgi:16S rRNA (guanine527-N7)-methyltransferase|nr:16S rRNA (guanine(527)-N(7))-methyltransferase RsmG [Bacteroidales bacterium]